MSDELKITRERVLEAANCCPTAKATLAKLFPEVFTVGTYSPGQRFLIKGDDLIEEEFILANVDHRKCCLISLKDGNRWTHPTTVYNASKITAAELKLMLGINGKIVKVL